MAKITGAVAHWRGVSSGILRIAPMVNAKVTRKGGIALVYDTGRNTNGGDCLSRPSVEHSPGMSYQKQNGGGAAANTLIAIVDGVTRLSGWRLNLRDSCIQNSTSGGGPCLFLMNRTNPDE